MNECISPADISFSKLEMKHQYHNKEIVFMLTVDVKMFIQSNI